MLAVGPVDDSQSWTTDAIYIEIYSFICRNQFYLLSTSGDIRYIAKQETDGRNITGMELPLTARQFDAFYFFSFYIRCRLNDIHLLTWRIETETNLITRMEIQQFARTRPQSDTPRDIKGKSSLLNARTIENNDIIC